METIREGLLLNGLDVNGKTGDSGDRIDSEQCCETRSLSTALARELLLELRSKILDAHHRFRVAGRGTMDGSTVI